MKKSQHTLKKKFFEEKINGASYRDIEIIFWTRKYYFSTANVIRIFQWEVPQKSFSLPLAHP
jgi:hypothetical protein